MIAKVITYNLGLLDTTFSRGVITADSLLNVFNNYFIKKKVFNNVAHYLLQLTYIQLCITN